MRRRAPLTRISCACGKSSKPIPASPCTFAPSTVRDISSCDSSRSQGEETPIRLRTKFLIAMLLTSAGLTAVSLLIVQRTVASQVRRGLGNDLANSVVTFRNAQKDREAVLARSAKLIADLPSLKALMTSRHPPTIQDASGEMFRLSGGDLFALLDPSGQFVGFHTKEPGITR